MSSKKLTEQQIVQLKPIIHKFNELLEEKRSNDKINENTKNVIKHIDNTTRNTLIKEENNLNKKMSKKEAV